MDWGFGPSKGSVVVMSNCVETGEGVRRWRWRGGEGLGEVLVTGSLHFLCLTLDLTDKPVVVSHPNPLVTNRVGRCHSFPPKTTVILSKSEYLVTHTWPTSSPNPLPLSYKQRRPGQWHKYVNVTRVDISPQLGCQDCVEWDVHVFTSSQPKASLVVRLRLRKPGLDFSKFVVHRFSSVYSEMSG